MSGLPPIAFKSTDQLPQFLATYMPITLYSHYPFPCSPVAIAKVVAPLLV